LAGYKWQVAGQKQVEVKKEELPGNNRTWMDN
jgi:hypothetical protein